MQLLRACQQQQQRVAARLSLDLLQLLPSLHHRQRTTHVAAATLFAPALQPAHHHLASIKSISMDQQPLQVIESTFLLAPPTPSTHVGADADHHNVDLASPQQPSIATPLHLVILNWSLPRWLLRVWPSAVVRVCADGGANRLYDELPAMLPDEPPEQVRRRFLPDLIHGDLDSLRPEVLSFYQAHGVAVLQCPDQDSTDLGKCLDYLEKQHAAALLLAPPARSAGVNGAGAGGAGAGGAGAGGGEGSHHGGGEGSHHANGSGEAGAGGQAAANGVGDGRDDARGGGGGVVEGRQGLVLAIGALGGRLDHTLSNLNALYMHRHLSLALLGEGNLVRLVRAGKCVIRPARQVEGPLCGLVPLAGPAVVTMTGFRWNLERGEMRMGGLVSTSNIMESDTITVETDADLVWTTQLHDAPGDGDGLDGGIA